MTTLNPAERYAALKLLDHGLKAALATAASEAEAYRQSVRAKSLETDWGTVTVARRKPSIRFDERRLIEWCEDNLPDLVHKSVPTESQTWLKTKRFTIDGESVIDTATGEEVDWATVHEGSDYLTVRLSTEAKVAAVETVSSRVELLADALPQLTDKDN